MHILEIGISHFFSCSSSFSVLFFFFFFHFFESHTFIYVRNLLSVEWQWAMILDAIGSLVVFRVDVLYIVSVHYIRV